MIWNGKNKVEFAKKKQFYKEEYMTSCRFQLAEKLIQILQHDIEFLNYEYPTCGGLIIFNGTAAT